jgi:hypothetical protein
VSAKDDERSGWQSTSVTIENVEKNSRIHPRRPSPNNPWAHRHRWDQLGSLSGDFNRKFEHVPHCHEGCSPTLDKWSKAAPSKCVLSYKRRLMRTQLLSVAS